MIDTISTPSSAAAMFRAALPEEQKEERVFVLPLDGSGRALAKPILVSVGDKDGTTTIDVGAIFREALKAGAEEVVVAHNHPSGDPLGPHCPRRAGKRRRKGLRVASGARHDARLAVEGLPRSGEVSALWRAVASAISLAHRRYDNRDKRDGGDGGFAIPWQSFHETAESQAFAIARAGLF